MQPFAVSRDSVIKLRGNAAVWWRLNARKPEIVECFSVGAQACGEQRQRREHGYNADVHATNFAVYYGRDRGGSMPIFRLYREAFITSGGYANGWNRAATWALD